MVVGTRSGSTCLWVVDCTTAVKQEVCDDERCGMHGMVGMRPRCVWGRDVRVGLGGRGCDIDFRGKEELIVSKLKSGRKNVQRE